MSRRLATMLALLVLGMGAAAAHAADPADFPALEWTRGEGARELVGASEGVVFVDLFAHY